MPLKTDLNVGGGGAKSGKQGERDAESHPGLQMAASEQRTAGG